MDYRPSLELLEAYGLDVRERGLGVGLGHDVVVVELPLLIRQQLPN